MPQDIAKKKKKKTQEFPGCRRGSDPALLWLWHRPAAIAPIRPLAWEPPYAAGAAQEMAKRQEKKKKKNPKNQAKRIFLALQLTWLIV